MTVIRNLWARVRRQPTLVLQAINAILAWLVTFQLPGLSTTQAAAIVALLSALLGAINAWHVRPVAPAVWQLLVTSGAALVSAYGFHVTQQQIGGLETAVIAVMALLTWQSASPANGSTLVGYGRHVDQRPAAPASTTRTPGRMPIPTPSPPHGDDGGTYRRPSMR